MTNLRWSNNDYGAFVTACGGRALRGDAEPPFSCMAVNGVQGVSKGQKSEQSRRRWEGARFFVAPLHRNDGDARSFGMTVGEADVVFAQSSPGRIIARDDGCAVVVIGL